MSPTTSLVISDEIDRALNDMVSESVRRQDAEEMSRSEIMRKLIRDGIEEFDLGDLLSEERRILLRREQFKDEQAQVRNLRSGFEPRVKRHFKERFENGTKPEGLDQFAENMVRDAYLIWPEWADSDYSERREEAIEFVEAVCAKAKQARKESGYDPLDPETIFDSYEGVEAGREKREIEQARESGAIEDWHAEARKRVQRLRKIGGTPDRDDMIQALRNEGASEAVAIEAVEQALGLDGGDQGVPADD